MAIPVIIYSFNIINWVFAEIKNTDTKVRKLITCDRMHHPRVNIECPCVKRKWWKSFSPIRIDLRNNHYKIKEILKYYNRLDASVIKHSWETKEKLFV